MHDFVLWHNHFGRNDCSLRDFNGFEDTFDMLAGVSLQDTFPVDASFSMDEDEPHGTLLLDSLSNTDRVIVASARLTELVRQKAPAGVEYLPVSILNHKHKAIPEKYSIVHLTDPLDCLDLRQATVEYSAILPDEIHSIDRLALRDDQIPPERMIFRAIHFVRVIFVRRTLADEITAHRFTGVRWKELSEYQG